MKSHGESWMTEILYWSQCVWWMEAMREREGERKMQRRKFLSRKINNKSNEPSECLVSSDAKSEPDVGNMGMELWMDGSKEDKQSSNGGILYTKLLQHNYLRFNIMHSERIGKGRRMLGCVEQYARRAVSVETRSNTWMSPWIGRPKKSRREKEQKICIIK